MPGTAAALGVTDSDDPAQAIEGGAKYLRQQLDAFGGDVSQGARRLQRRPRRGAALRRRAARTPRRSSYVQKVLGYAAEYRTQTPRRVPSTPTIT